MNLSTLAHVCAVAAALAAAIGVVVIAFLLPRRHCPHCGTLLPRFRMPTSLREAMLGGMRCPRCQAPLSRNGTPGA